MTVENSKWQHIRWLSGAEMTYFIYQSINQSSNQSINQPITQSIIGFYFAQYKENKSTALQLRTYL